MYQYRIDEFDVDGITDVRIVEYSEDFSQATMKGWFYYVPSQNMLQFFDEKSKPTLETIIGKRYNIDWLKLFGKITLTKIPKEHL